MADTEAVQINTDARMMAARLTTGQDLVHKISAKGKAYLVTTDAVIWVNGTMAKPLDGLLVGGKSILTIRADAATEGVMVDLI